MRKGKKGKKINEDEMFSLEITVRNVMRKRQIGGDIYDHLGKDGVRPETSIERYMYALHTYVCMYDIGCMYNMESPYYTAA